MSDPQKLESERTPHWRESAAEFCSARVELFALEAKEAGKFVAKRGALGAILAVFAVTAWLTGIAGLIGWIASAGSFPWFMVALSAAALFLLGGGIIVLAILRPASPPFPLFKAELQKDREWLNRLNSKPKP